MSVERHNAPPELEEIQFLLGVSVLAYEDGRVKCLPWGRYGGIIRVGYDGLRRLGEDEQEATA